MSACPSEREWSALQDGEVTAERRRQMHDHLQQCEQCLATKAGFDRLTVSLAAWEDRPVPPRLTGLLLQAAAATGGATRANTRAQWLAIGLIATVAGGVQLWTGLPAFIWSVLVETLGGAVLTVLLVLWDVVEGMASGGPRWFQLWLVTVSGAGMLALTVWLRGLWQEGSSARSDARPFAGRRPGNA